MPTATFTRSFRVRLLIVVVLVALVPIGLVGVWIVQRASRAGEDLLRGRVTEALNFTGAGISQRWIERRSRLLDLAQAPSIRQATAGSAAAGSETDALLQSAVATLSMIRLHDARGNVLASAAPPRPPGAFVAPGLTLTVPVHESPLGRTIGSIEAVIPVSSLVIPEASRPGSIGAIVGIYDAAGTTPFVPLPFDPADSGDRLAWGGDDWLLVSRSLADVPVKLIGAAPLSPFRAPARDAARSSLWILLIVSGAGVLLTILTTTQMTRSLERLAVAADSVATGSLDLRIEPSGADEVARVGRAFNQMIASLRTTMQQLADQRALARIGEFAATLAHEVRNPLTAIRVDLQVAQESVPTDARAARPLGRALEEVDRLDRTVSAALLATRASRGESRRVDVLAPLLQARDSAIKTSSRPIDIEVEAPQGPVIAAGDAGALEQLFLNVLLNAVEAVKEHGTIRVAVAEESDRIVVRVTDTGVGLTPEAARDALKPFFTTRPDGTGLGLTIASRLARALGGSLTLEGAPGHGATATIVVPRTAGPEPASM